MTIEITDEMVRDYRDVIGDCVVGRDCISCDREARKQLAAALTIIEQQVRAALEAPIRELHKPVPMVPGLDDTPVCDGCENPGRFVPSPCPTIRALDGDK